MTHIGDNPFISSGDTSIDDELVALLSEDPDQDAEIEARDQEGLEILAEMLPVIDSFSSFGVKRLIDVDTANEDELQEARLAVIQEEIEDDLLKTEEGAALYADGSLRTIVEYRSYMALIAERRLQQYITTLAIKMRDLYDTAGDEEKEEILKDIEFEKRTYILLLTEHYGLDSRGWPAAFNAITPGVGILPGMDVEVYRTEADKHARMIRQKDIRERDELKEVGEAIGIDTLDDPDEKVGVMVTLAVIQECIDNIEAVGHSNALAQRGEMIWELGTRAGLPPEACQEIAQYYDKKRPLVA